jgi:hypothetical protein
MWVCTVCTYKNSDVHGSCALCEAEPRDVPWSIQKGRVRSFNPWATTGGRPTEINVSVQSAVVPEALASELCEGAAVQNRQELWRLFLEIYNSMTRWGWKKADVDPAKAVRAKCTTFFELYVQAPVLTNVKAKAAKGAKELFVTKRAGGYFPEVMPHIVLANVIAFSDCATLAHKPPLYHTPLYLHHSNHPDAPFQESPTCQDVTPYIHMLVFHIPDLMERFSGNLMQVTLDPLCLCAWLRPRVTGMPTFRLFTFSLIR